DADPDASDTNSALRWPNANPNGVAPADAADVRAPAAPFSPTTYTSSRFVVFSVTTSRRPSGLNDTCAGPTFVPESGRMASEIGARSPLALTVNPLMLPSPPVFST